MNKLYATFFSSLGFIIVLGKLMYCSWPTGYFDAFYKTIAKDDSLIQIFPKLCENVLCSKIESQFKVLEKGQAHYEEPFDLQIIQDFVVNKLGYDIVLHKVKEEKLEWTGHLNILFKKLDNDLRPFSWTSEIYKRL